MKKWQLICLLITLNATISFSQAIHDNGSSVGIGTTAPAGKLDVRGEAYVNGGWLRIKGQKGLYFHDFGGGFRMIDHTWIRTFGDKSFYHNAGTMRTDGVFQVGPDGNRFLVKSDGKVGVGTPYPEKELTVNGDISIEGSNAFLYAKLPQPIGTLQPLIGLEGANTSVKSKEHYNIEIESPGHGEVHILGKKVGIGTTNPTAKLTVDGNILAEEVKIVADISIPDYVFANNYQLSTLEEVNTFIKKNHHLPNIPSEKEIKADGGFKLGEMNMKLLEKIEELTLYQIELLERIKKLEANASK